MSDKPKKGNAFKIIIIILLSLVVIGGAAFGTMYFLGEKSSSATANPAKATKINELTYPLDEFLVNLIDDDGKRYLKLKVVIGYEDNKKLTAELETKKPIIRDVINTTLRAKKTTDFSAKGVEDIKNQLIGNINPVLTDGKISNIYFTDILVQ